MICWGCFCDLTTAGFPQAPSLAVYILGRIIIWISANVVQCTEVIFRILTIDEKIAIQNTGFYLLHFIIKNHIKLLRGVRRGGRGARAIPGIYDVKYF